MFTPADDGNAVGTEADAARWRRAGTERVGGTLAGVRSKLGYLRRMGVTAIWISPVLKQAAPPAGDQANYHGYATQDFLSVDPAFGTNDDLRGLVADAHAAGLRVILDVVLNHAGDVFGYDLGDVARYPARDDSPLKPVDPRWDGREYPVAGWRPSSGGLEPFTPAAAAALWPDGAVFPAELHDPQAFTRRGRIDNWDYQPEFVQGDFFGLKDVHHGAGSLDDYRASPALVALARAYCWWLAFADLDGFRIDTVKHMDRGATRYVASVVHEFAESIGKDRFLLVGEITGPRSEAIATMELTGLDAALGLADVQDQLERAATGDGDPAGYFSLFRNSELIGKDSHTWLRDTVVTSFDDHDQVRKGGDEVPIRRAARRAGARYCRFSRSTRSPSASRASTTAPSNTSTAAVRGRTRTGTSGRRCSAGSSGPSGAGGGTCSTTRRAATWTWRDCSRCAAPSRPCGAAASTCGRSPANGIGFALPTGFGGAVRSVVAWSRILADREVLCAVNTDPAQPRQAWVTVDAGLHRPGDAAHAAARGPPRSGDAPAGGGPQRRGRRRRTAARRLRRVRLECMRSAVRWARGDRMRP